jgi:hypothetical protein
MFTGSILLGKILQQNNDCAGQRCSKKGVHQLTIIYLNRKGWFCNTCKQDLVKEGLALENIRPEVQQPQNQQYHPASGSDFNSQFGETESKSRVYSID